jgi:predicted nucleotidyltransferase
MSREFVELLRRRAEERRRIVENLEEYLRRVRDAARELDPDARVYLFGSYARGTPRPDSDVDILIVSDAYGGEARRAVEMILHITERVGGVGVFELHVATREEFENWYRRLIDTYREIF